MTQTTETRPGGVGSGNAISLGGEGLPDNTTHPKTQDKFRNPRAVREARLELLREAVHESCGFIRLHAETCQLLVDAGDDAGMLHALGRLITYTKHAARVGNDLRALRGGAR